MCPSNVAGRINDKAICFVLKARMAWMAQVSWRLFRAGFRSGKFIFFREERSSDELWGKQVERVSPSG